MWILCILQSVIVARLSFAADLTGTVKYTGPAPKTNIVKMNADPNCLKEAAGAKVTKEDVVVNSNGTLANVFVYVKSGVKPGSASAGPGAPVTFDQKGCMYTPHVVGVRVGQKFRIVNSDSTMHNVHSLSKSNGFNDAMPIKGQVIEKVFKKAEPPFKVKCDVHGWMLGYIGVMDHPFFAVTDSLGGFKIAGLPPGDYTLEAWHEKLGAKISQVKVADGAAAPVDFAF
jgi:plastocyanin